MKSIKPGQYFETGSIIASRWAGSPKVCVEVSKTRVYYRRVITDSDRHADERRAEEAARPPSFCSIDSVGVICDTMAEMLEIDEAAKQSKIDLDIAHRENKIAFMRKLSEIRAKHQPTTTAS